MPEKTDKHILFIRNDTDIKIDLLKTSDGWFAIRWLRIEQDGTNITQKRIGLSVDEIRCIAKAAGVIE